jgi:hypothetical protein
MTKDWKFGLMFAGALSGFVAVVGFMETRPSSGDTCWRDPYPKLHLDYDFHGWEGDVPVRCGYLEPKPGSVLPRVLGEDARAELSDVMCYRLERKECEGK